MRNLLCLPLLHKLMLGIELLRCWSARDKQKILGYTLDAANYYVFSSPLGHLQTFYTILSALFTLCYFHSAWPILCFHSAWFSLYLEFSHGFVYNLNFHSAWRSLLIFTWPFQSVVFTLPGLHSQFSFNLDYPRFSLGLVLEVSTFGHQINFHSAWFTLLISPIGENV